MKTREGPGRPRDVTIDDRILEVTRRHLAARGYDRLSLAAVAEEARTTRPALYRRWPGKAELATAAIAALADAKGRPPTDDPFADLVRELEAFQRGVTRPDGLSLVGTMLQQGTDATLLELYRQRIVQPRRQRIRAIIERAVASGELSSGDIDLAVASLTGSFYALALAGSVAAHWPERAAAHVWSALGGERAMV